MRRRQKSDIFDMIKVGILLFRFLVKTDGIHKIDHCEKENLLASERDNVQIQVGMVYYMYTSYHIDTKKYRESVTVY